MPHLFLALSIVCLSLGAGIIVLAFILAGRHRSRAFRLFGFLLCASSLLLFAEALRTYESVLRVALGPAHVPLLAGLLGAAGAAAAFLIPTFCFDLVALPVGRGRRAVHLCLGGAAVILAVLQEVAAPAVFWRANSVFLFGVHGYGFMVLWGNRRRVADPRVRSLVDRVLLLVAVFAPLGMAQIVLHGLPAAPPILRDYPPEPLLYFLAVLILLYVYAGRYLFVPAAPPDYQVPTSTAALYGISEREREIITLVFQGYSQRQIAERLSISASTVKNHVYNVYQKTGAENRVRLLNLLFPR